MLERRSAHPSSAEVRLRSAPCQSRVFAKAASFHCDTDRGAVPPFSLGGVQGAVGPTQDRTSIVSLKSLGNPGAEGVRQVNPVLDEQGWRKAIPDPVDDAERVVSPGTG